MTKNPIQGCSLLATPIKQQGLVGIYETIALRQKNPFRHPDTVFMDLYSGIGTNRVNGMDVNGSPISMLEGIRRGVGKMRDGGPRGSWRILFSDIAPERATNLLLDNVVRWQSETGLEEDPHKVRLETADGDPVIVPIQYMQASAQDVVIRTQDMFRRYPTRSVVMLVDPNGPKHAPWEELRSLWGSHGTRLKYLFHISATALKRVAGARARTGYDFAPMPDHIADMVSVFQGCGGWGRAPIGPDQWTILMLDKFPPRCGWESQGFYSLDSTAWQEIQKRLSRTLRELEFA